jgi:hypothetical protein
MQYVRKRYWIKVPKESDKNENETKKFQTIGECKIAIKH